MPDAMDQPRAIIDADRTPRWLLRAISFCGGLQIMVLEMCGFRVLETRLGSSVLVTGTLLMLIVSVLSLGYYTGGRLSARHRNARGLFGLLLCAALYTEVVTGAFYERLGDLCLYLYTALGPHSQLRATIPAGVLTLLSCGPPIFLMSMISPYLIRISTMSTSSRGKAEAGRQSGLFMALSTLGSIAGTLIASYLLIPFVGPAATARASNTVFLLLALVGWLWSASSTPAAWLARTLARLIITGLAVNGLDVALACDRSDPPPQKAQDVGT